MKEIIVSIGSSFNNNEGTGKSSKKLTAFVLVLCVFTAHIKWIATGDFSQLIPVLTVDYGFIAVLFGINEYGKGKTIIPSPSEQRENKIHQDN